ncbi:adhesive plaque matrix protein-like [Physella acuta]|uniref:adhesive plaque matrix protein-like n=1 Tax=Physella acuta TaxID=109671 RepID=UPI0027DBA08E|nr:adhesive plaque matrix protein-like [Physella acuta]
MCCLDKSNLGASHLTSVGVHGLCQVYTGNLSDYLRMSGTRCNPLLVLGLVGSFIGLAFFIVGLATPCWLVSTVSGDESSRGLFQGCPKSGLCFTFPEYSNREIVVQALVITAAVVAFIANIVALAFSIQSCKTTPTDKKAAIASLVLAFLAGLLGFSGSLFYAVGFYSIDTFNIHLYLKTQLSYSFGLTLTASLVMPFSACFFLTGAINMVSASRAPQGQVVSSVPAPMSVLYTGQNAMVAYPYQPNQMVAYPYQPNQMGSQPYPTTQMGSQPSPTTQMGSQPYPTTQMGSQPYPTTQMGSQPAQTTQMGSQPYPTTQMGSQPYPTTQMGAQPYPTTQMGSQPYPTTQMGAQPYPTTQMGSQPYPTTQMGSQPAQTTQMGSQPYPTTQMGSQPYPTTQMGAQPAHTTQNGAQPFQPKQMYAPSQYPPNQQYAHGQFQANQHYVNEQPPPYQPNLASMPANAATPAVSSQRLHEYDETNVYEN